MAYQSMWYQTRLPEDLVEVIQSSLSEFDSSTKKSELIGERIDLNKRNSKNSWIDGNHWISGLLWHYIQKANRENFLYDLTCIDGESMQYTFYEQGNFYDWHTDSNLANWYSPVSFIETLEPPKEHIRKLSAIIQLSDEHSYKGGNLEFQDENLEVYNAPRERGTVIVFDSRTRHRVTEVTEGERRSVVCWVIGPRWK